MPRPNQQVVFDLFNSISQVPAMYPVPEFSRQRINDKRFGRVTRRTEYCKSI